MKVSHLLLFVTALAASLSSSTAAPSPDLLTWIPFSSRAAVDVGTSPKALLTGNVEFPDEAVAPGDCSSTPARFNGQNSFVEIQGSSAMNLLPVTVALWIKAPAQTSTDAGLVTKYGIAGANGFGVFTFGDRIRAWYFGSQGRVYGPNEGVTSSPVLDGSWHHVAVAFDGSGGRLFVDGMLHDSVAWEGSAAACTTSVPVLIGEYRAVDGSERRMHYNGMMSDVRIYSASLSASQIKADYETQMPQRLLASIDGQFVARNVVRRGSATINLQTAFSDGVILYSLDGSEPSLGSKLYSGPFTLRQSCSLRAVAYSADFSREARGCPVDIVILPTLTATSAGGGTVTINPPNGPYLSDSTATVTASPEPGWAFLHWLGDASGTEPVATLRMMRDKHVEAVFGTTVTTAIIGSGAIRQEPTASFYPYGATIRFSGVPSGENYLAFWAGGATSTEEPFEFRVTNAAPAVTAVFQAVSPGEFALTASVEGRGSMSASPTGHRHKPGVIVQITALAQAGQAFTGWSGDASGAQNPLTVTMDRHKVITANFTKRPTLRIGTRLEGLFDDGFRMTVNGEFGAHYEILKSTDLGEWLRAGRVTNVFGSVQFTDSAPTDAVQFYRVTIAEP